MSRIDLPPGVLNPVRDYSDVEDIITRNWPTREAMICAKGVDGSRFKRLLGLIVSGLDVNICIVLVSCSWGSGLILVPEERYGPSTWKKKNIAGHPRRWEKPTCRRCWTMSSGPTLLFLLDPSWSGCGEESGTCVVSGTSYL